MFFIKSLSCENLFYGLFIEGKHLLILRGICQNNFIRIILGIKMQFYQHSTPKEGSNGEEQKTIKSQTSPSSKHLLQLNSYFSEYLKVSNSLYQELLKNIDLINALKDQNPKKRVGNEQEIQNIQENSPTQKINQTQLTAKNASDRNTERRSESDQSYMPEEEESREINGSKISQSKNIPKNYGKAIIAFIRRNSEYTKRVLELVGMNKDEFMENLEELRDRINTIPQLRSMWIDSENKFAKAYRILSAEYLRKHSLSYILSQVSRIRRQNKNRTEMIGSISNPTDFNRVKEF